MTKRAFSLVEVVVAVGVFAIAVVALLGVLTATTKTVADILDSDVAAKLATSVEAEIRRYASTQTNFDVFASGIPLASASNPLELYATKTGDRVLVASAANANLLGSTLGQPRGLYGRDRFYLVKVTRQPLPLTYNPGDGFVALTVVVEWPYQLPLGPEDNASTAVGTEGLDFSRTEAEDRNVYLLNLAITP